MTNPLDEVREQTLVLIKPDAVRKRVIGKIITIYEQAGLSVQGLRTLNPMSRDLLELFYFEHKGKDFYPRLIKFMIDGITVAIHLVGPSGTLEKVRELNGATDSSKAAPGTIRQLYGAGGPANAVHASATEADALRELSLFFDSCL